jgi:membrane protein YdbS with pleckstrin-like domain
MSATEEEIAQVEKAYRRATFKLLINLAFLVACCIGAMVVRNMVGLPPAFLTVVLVLALVLFSPEIWRFMVLRHKVRALRGEE